MKSTRISNSRKSTKFSIKNIVFFDGYYIDDGEIYDMPTSKKRYNSYKQLKFINPKIDLNNCTNIYNIIRILADIDRVYTANRITAAFSHFTLRIGSNDFSITYETIEDYSHLRRLGFTNKEFFYKQFIEQGIDLNLLPAYIERLNTENLQANLENKIYSLKTDKFYNKIFGEGNLADKILLEDFMPKLQDNNKIFSFIKAIHASWADKPITINNIHIPIHLIIDFEELLQTKGHFNSNNCVFRKAKSKIMIDNKESRIIILFKIRKGHILYLFTTNKENLEVLAYFLFSYFSSECRLKRSIPPLNILSQFGVIKMQKAYRTKITNNYTIKENWFAINNPKDKRQSFFNKECKIYNIL